MATNTIFLDFQRPLLKITINYKTGKNLNVLKFSETENIFSAKCKLLS